MRNGILLILAFAVTASSLGAQTSTDSVHARNDCRLAEQTLATGHPEPHLEWASEYIGRCGSEVRSKSMVAALRQHRASSDTALLRVIWRPTIWFQDVAVYGVALDIAGDPGASVESRVYALRALALIARPNRVIGYENLVGGWENGVPISRPSGGCARGQAHATYRSVGQPLPPDHLQKIAELAVRLSNDSTQPLDVRTAATCI